jgi:hypothetical protein
MITRSVKKMNKRTIMLRILLAISFYVLQSSFSLIAQECFKEIGKINRSSYFVKAFGDTVICYQASDSLHVVDLRTDTVIHKIDLISLHGIKGIPRPYVTNVIQYDSILIIEFSFSFLRTMLVARGECKRIRTVLDSISEMSNSYGFSIDAMLGNILLLGLNNIVYSMKIDGKEISLMDSISISQSRSVCLLNDTLLVGKDEALGTDTLIFYYVRNTGELIKIKKYGLDGLNFGMVNRMQANTEGLYVDVSLGVNIYKRNGERYSKVISNIWQCDKGIFVSLGRLIMIGMSGDVVVSTTGGLKICQQSIYTSDAVVSASMTGNKLYLASPASKIRIYEYVGATNYAQNIHPIASDVDMQIYPNPASGEQYLKYIFENRGVRHIIISNMYGKEVMRLNNVQTDKGEIIRLDISNLQAGTYFCVVYDGDKLYTKRMAVLR